MTKLVLLAAGFFLAFLPFVRRHSRKLPIWLLFHFLIEQLKLRPVPDAVIAAIPNLYQPPAPN